VVSGAALPSLGPVGLVGIFMTANENAIPLPGPTSLALGLDSVSEPVFPPAAWLEEISLADHPLLRGLLLELPPKGSPPSPEWLNRWFETARAILELLYGR
jgi:hypothetical protein